MSVPSDDSTIATTSNETHGQTLSDSDSDSDSASPPSTPEMIDTDIPSSDSADSESESPASPADSLFSNSSYKPDLRGPEPDEEPQYRGRITHGIREAPHTQPPAPPAPLPNH